MAFKSISRMQLLRVAAVCSFPLSAYLGSEKATASPIEDALPKEVDWVARGAVTPPRDQGMCGGCWAHATVSSIESIYQIKCKRLLRLSVQEVLDCAEREEEINGKKHHVKGKGCRGGYAKEAFAYVKKHGIAAEKDYPQRRFLGSIMGDGKCRYMKLAAFISGWGYTEPSEEALMKATARQPIVVGAAPMPDELDQDYKGAIIEFEQWPPSDSKTGHALLVVGYGEDENGKFWKVKNSRGTKWGKGGFAYLRRGVSDRRGVAGIVASRGFYPILNSCREGDKYE
ncbi:hypothetical protein ACP70R_043831 [Stipagrostis hirtigluma subsp. patula]